MSKKYGYDQELNKERAINIVETERLIITLLDCNSSDICNMFSWCNDADIQKYLHIPCKSECQFRLYFVNRINHNQKIFIAKLKQPNDDNSVICWCRINPIGKVSIMWICHPNYRNKGYITEMVKAILDSLSIGEISAFINSKNIASQKVAEKLGFIPTSTRPVSNGFVQVYVKSQIKK